MARSPLLLDRPPDSVFGVDTPVVMLDLPESYATSPLPPTDLAPGPKEEESEATPPPKEETKPPETQAEVALPEPPKPEPPQVESSGSSDLDQEALAMLTRAQPMPRPPDRIPTRELSFLVPIKFTIR